MTAVRRLVRVLVITAAVLIGTLAVALVTTQTAWFKDWLRRYVIRQADEYLNAELRIDRLAGNLLTGLELQNMQVIQDGETIIAVKDVGLDYNVLDIVSQGLVIDSQDGLVHERQGKLSKCRGARIPIGGAVMRKRDDATRCSTANAWRVTSDPQLFQRLLHATLAHDRSGPIHAANRD